ncbi:MAG: nuclear transport factor 2 family protein [Siphonobacter sp.]
MKTFLILAILVLTGFVAKAQSDDELIKITLQNYLDGGANGDTARLNRAFYPTANLRSLKDGRVTSTPVREFIGRTPQGGAKWNGRIVSYSYLNTAGSAVLEMELESFKFVDFLSLMKIGSDWKIVSRVFTRADKDQTITSFGGGKTSGTQKKPVAKPKPKSDDGWE